MYSHISNLADSSELFQKRFITLHRPGASKAYLGCNELNKAPFTN